MNKQTEALKHHAEKYGLTLDQFRMMCNGASEMYEGQGMASPDYALAREAYFAGFTKACKDALEQPAQHKWSADGERCVKCGDKDWMGGSCSVADEHPAQEPVAWISVKDKLPPQEINFLSFSETFGYQVSMYSNNPVNSTGLPTLEKLKIVKWMSIPLYTHPAPQPAQEPVAWMHRHEGEITEFNDFQSCDKCEPLYTHPAPSWQGLSDDEIWDIANFLGKNKEWDYPVMFAKTIEKALKEKNHEQD